MFCDFLKKILKWSSASLPLFKFVNKYFSICWREQIWVLSPCARDTFMNQNRDFYALVTVTASNRIWGLQIPKHLLEEVKSPIKTSFAAKRWSLSISWGKFYLYTIRDIDARRNTVFKTLTAAWFTPVSLFPWLYFTEKLVNLVFRTGLTLPWPHLPPHLRPHASAWLCHQTPADIGSKHDSKTLVIFVWAGSQFPMCGALQHN